MADQPKRPSAFQIQQAIDRISSKKAENPTETQDFKTETEFLSALGQLAGSIQSRNAPPPKKDTVDKKEAEPLLNFDEMHQVFILQQENPMEWTSNKIAQRFQIPEALIVDCFKLFSLPIEIETDPNTNIQIAKRKKD